MIRGIHYFSAEVKPKLMSSQGAALIFQYESVSQFSAARSQPKQLSKCLRVLSLLFIY